LALFAVIGWQSYFSSRC